MGNGGDGAVITLSNLTDRSDYDVRGRKITKPSPTRGRTAAQHQRRLSAKGQEMLNSAMGAFPQQTQAMPSYAQPVQRQQPSRQAPPQQQQQQQQQQQRPRTSPKKGNNIFDRLTDSSQYTGAHKHRFDSEGRGRGLEGRDRIATGRGYVGQSPQKDASKQYKGSTNTGSNQVFHDSSQFLMRR